MSGLKQARHICAGNALLLALLWGLWYGWLAPSDTYGTGIALIGVLPLLLFTAGVVAGKVRGMAALGFISLFYLAHGLMELMANPEVRLMASASTVLSLLLFLTASHCLRIHRMQQGEQPPK
jgi:uncharacterized membrane protein